jgi:dipeptidase E
LNVYWQIPFLKITFFKTSILQFFLTPFGIAGVGALGALLIFFALIYYIIGVIKAAIKHNQAKTLLLTSGGMPQMKDEILKLLQKPAYDVTVAFITTASKPQENQDYLNIDLQIMREELRFNVEEVDIDGKKEAEVMKLLELKDIIFVEGGNTFYLLKAMRACNFEKVIRKLLKLGKVYIGASAGTIVAGKTIKTTGWLGDEYENKNLVKLRNLKGLNLVPFDIFVHYTPEWADVIKQKMKNPRKRFKKLRILTDDQGILVQGKEIDLIGDGEAVII